jgi:hypothetical protein
MKGVFKFKKLINDKGFYGEVILEVHRTTLGRVEVDLGTATKWRSSIEFAARYFLDHNSRAGEGGLKITILDLKDMDVDTNHMMVFFVVVNALCHAFGIPCDLTINDAGNFVIPK